VLEEVIDYLLHVGLDVLNACVVFLFECHLMLHFWWTVFMH
jgi:hypothetical protein